MRTSPTIWGKVARFDIIALIDKTIMNIPIKVYTFKRLKCVSTIICCDIILVERMRFPLWRGKVVIWFLICMMI